ncbi:MAG: cytochrome c maturation protein CcmE [Rickettsiaceae bacterium]
MKKRAHSRLFSIMGLFIIASVGIYFILSNLEDNIVFFYPPSDIEKIINAKTKIRVGGLVKENSIEVLAPNQIRFTITDYQHDLVVEYVGLLPTLFREKQGIVAEGIFTDGLFLAKRLLAKHDENYMPPEVKKILTK